MNDDGPGHGYNPHVGRTLSALWAGGEVDEWKNDAACIGAPEHVFFPKRGQKGGRIGDRAKAICAGCRVRAECLDYAMRHEIEHGVWGGTSANQREKLRGWK